MTGSHGQDHLPRGPRGLDDVMMGLRSPVQGVLRADDGPQPPRLHPGAEQRRTLPPFLLEGVRSVTSLLVPQCIMGALLLSTESLK